MELKKPLVVIAAVIGLAACGEALQPGLARKVRSIFDGIPSQLSRHDRVYRLSSLATARAALR